MPSESNEEAAIRRVIAERKQRGWSQAELARRVTAVGVPLSQSSLWKLEQGTPRRPLSVDELFAFAAVFGLDVSAMLAPPDFQALFAAAVEMQTQAARAREDHRPCRRRCRRSATRQGERRDPQATRLRRQVGRGVRQETGRNPKGQVTWHR